MCKWCCIAWLVIVVLVSLLQYAMYSFASHGCSASSLSADYPYPGGGAKDLLPADSLLLEEAESFWGGRFTVQPADGSGSATGASTGVWFRTWGPLFYTYSHRDVQSKYTCMAREEMLSFEGSHKMWRCDGTGPTYVVSQGSHFLINFFRKLFGMYTSSIYNIYEDSNVVAWSQKVGSKLHNIQVLYLAPGEATSPYASADLRDRSYHGHFDVWFVANFANSTLPNWVTSATTAFMAFDVATSKNNRAPAPAPTPKPHSLLDANQTEWQFVDLAEEAVEAAAEEERTVPGIVQRTEQHV